MKIAVMSDSHDHIWNVKHAVKSIGVMGISCIIHLGDLVSPFVLDEFSQYKGTVHLIFGNNPGDKYLLLEKIKVMGGKVQHHGMRGELEITGRRIVFVHDPHYAYALARTGEYDICLFGHTHRWHMEWIENTLLLNPGEILGKKEPPGWALLDLDTLSAERMMLHDEAD